MRPEPGENPRISAPWRAAHPGYQQAWDKKQREEGLNATARAYRVTFRAGLMAQARALYAAKKHVSFPDRLSSVICIRQGLGIGKPLVSQARFLGESNGNILLIDGCWRYASRGQIAYVVKMNPYQILPSSFRQSRPCEPAQEWLIAAAYRLVSIWTWARKYWVTLPPLSWTGRLGSKSLIPIVSQGLRRSREAGKELVRCPCGVQRQRQSMSRPSSRTCSTRQARMLRSPKIFGELNRQPVKLVKFQGEFVWHK